MTGRVARQILVGVLLVVAPLAGVSGRAPGQQRSSGPRLFILAAAELDEPSRFGAGVSYRPRRLRRSLGPVGGGIEVGLGAQRGSDGDLVLALSGGVGSFVTGSPRLQRVIPFAWVSGGGLLLREPEETGVGLSAALGTGFFVAVTTRSGVMFQVRAGGLARPQERRAFFVGCQIGYTL